MLKEYLNDLKSIPRCETLILINCLFVTQLATWILIINAFILRCVNLLTSGKNKRAFEKRLRGRSIKKRDLKK